MNALAIDVTPTSPPSLSVVVLTQVIDVGPSDHLHPVYVLVGIWIDGRIEALRGVPNWAALPPAAPAGFSPVAAVLLERGQAFVAERSIELIPSGNG